MFAPDNLKYYARRAATQRRLEKSAASPALAQLHAQLAEAYEAYVAEIEARPPLRLVSSSTGLDQPSAPLNPASGTAATG